MAKTFGMPMPGRPMSANTPPPPPGAPPTDEGGESYTVTPDELSELQTAGTVVTASGCTLTLDDQQEGSAPDDGGEDVLTQ